MCKTNIQRSILTHEEEWKRAAVLTHDTGIHQGSEDNEDVREAITIHITQFQWG